MSRRRQIWALEGIDIFEYIIHFDQDRLLFGGLESDLAVGKCVTQIDHGLIKVPATPLIQKGVCAAFEMKELVGAAEVSASIEVASFPRSGLRRQTMEFFTFHLTLD